MVCILNAACVCPVPIKPLINIPPVPKTIKITKTKIPEGKISALVKAIKGSKLAV